MATKFRELKTVYRYELDRRPGRSRYKQTCPSCGRPKCFTPYVDVTTGEPVGPEFGICDHARTCGYHRYPKGIDVGDKELYVSSNDVKDSFFKPKIGDIANMIPTKEVEGTIGFLEENIMFQFLTKLYGRDRVSEVFRRYKVGTCDLWSWKGCSIFWQVDKDFVCRTGKIMEYRIKKDEDGRPIDVKRVKEGANKHPHVMFYHAFKGGDYILKQCLFGEHLLSQFPDEPIRIVEAEKTAIICAINSPKSLFMATGGLNNFRPEVMDAIRGREIIAYPDKGSAYDKWRSKINKDLTFYGIKISDYLQRSELAMDGEDMADVLIKKRIEYLKNAGKY